MDFANQLCAAMGNTSPDDYKQRMQEYLANLDMFENFTKHLNIRTAKDFEGTIPFSSALNSLTCFTFNNKLPENDRVWAIESALGKKQVDYVKKSQAKGEHNLYVRYLLKRKHLIGDTNFRKWMLNQLVEAGRVFRKDGRFYLTGIYCKIGDNTFRVDYRGGQHRQYNDCTRPQAYRIERPDDAAYLGTLESWRILDLPDYFIEQDFGDGKYAAREPKVTMEEYHKLNKLMEMEAK
jgi:hypothetical protein